jgi:hypothetical protein
VTQKRNQDTASLILLTALSLSVGWGIRGNFGHEYGAMIPGALAAMGGVLLAGREDWWRRIAHFGFFGALGWSFGLSLAVALLSIVANWAVVRAVWGDQFAGHARLHIRFGPSVTATKEKPAKGQPHP